MPRVYANPTQDQFYAIPEDTDLPSGSLVLRSLSGAKIEVDAAAAAAFSITEDEAKQLVKGEVAAFTKQAATALSGIGSMLRGMGQNKDVPPPKTDAPNIVADTLGVTPDQLRNDPDAVKSGLQDVLAGLVSAVQDAMVDTPEARATTRARLRSMVSTMGDNAPDPDKLEAALDALRGTLGDPETADKIRAAADKLEAHTAKMKREGQDLLED